MTKPTKPITPVRREPTMADIAKLGGAACVKKHGVVHMMAIARLGGMARARGHSKEEMTAWAAMGGRARRHVHKKTPEEILEELLDKSAIEHH